MVTCAGNHNQTRITETHAPRRIPRLVRMRLRLADCAQWADW
jgi:hypothetical protein